MALSVEIRRDDCDITLRCEEGQVKLGCATSSSKLPSSFYLTHQEVLEIRAVLSHAYDLRLAHKETNDD